MNGHPTRESSVGCLRFFSLSGLSALPLRVYYVKPELYELGKTTGHFNGTALPLYDRERTICDCFKYRARLDHETFNKAVHAYAADPHKNLHNPSPSSQMINNVTITQSTSVHRIYNAVSTVFLSFTLIF